MKILIAYDPVHKIERLVADLKRAGFPSQSEAVVFCVADLVAPPSVYAFEAPFVTVDEAYVQSFQNQAKEGLRKARSSAANGVRAFKKAFPLWSLKAEACVDSPAWAIIKKAEDWKVDLIVVGSQPSNPVGRLIFGSTAQKVVGECFCSVRVVHGRSESVKANLPQRILIGVDGSAGCREAVEEVSRRNWNPGSSVYLVSAAEPHMDWTAKKKRTSKKEAGKGHWLEETIAAAGRKLQRAGLGVSFRIKEGDPKAVLLSEAKAWDPDMIFLGARGLRGIEKFLIGSVSAHIAARAACPVEIVRPKTRNKK